MRVRTVLTLAATAAATAALYACGDSTNQGTHGGSGTSSVSPSGSSESSTSTATSGGSSHASGSTGTSGTSSASNHSGTSGSSSTSGTSGSGSSSTTSSASASSTGGADGGSGNPVVHLDQKHQLIEGFGVNDTWGSGSIPAKEFDPTNGIGLSILRVGMNETGGFMSGNIQADINTVKSVSGTKIIGSCWSPPTNCKTSGSLNTGHAVASCYNSWATTITNFARSNGLYAMSIANEPDFESRPAGEPFTGAYPTTLYTANEMVAWVKVAGPMLQQAGIKVIAPEPSEWNHLWSNTSACCSQPSMKNSEDPFMCGFPPSNTACTTGSGYDYGHFLAKDAMAWSAFDIIGTHEYDSQQAYPWPSDVTATRKEVWETEMSGVKWWPEQGPSCDIADGIVVATWIHSALVVGDASAWVWWWYDGGSSASGTNENLVNVSGCSTGGPDTKRHYTLGNFSKFVRPGYTRVDVSGSAPSGVLLSAYADSAGSTVVIVAINSNSSAVTVPISIAGGTAPAQCTPTVTSATQNLTTATSAVSLSSGLSLAASTVTTFVCK